MQSAETTKFALERDGERQPDGDWAFTEKNAFSVSTEVTEALLKRLSTGSSHFELQLRLFVVQTDYTGAIRRRDYLGEQLQPTADCGPPTVSVGPRKCCVSVRSCLSGADMHAPTIMAAARQVMVASTSPAFCSPQSTGFHMMGLPLSRSPC